MRSEEREPNPLAASRRDIGHLVAQGWVVLHIIEVSDRAGTAAHGRMSAVFPSHSLLVTRNSLLNRVHTQTSVRYKTPSCSGLLRDQGRSPALRRRGCADRARRNYSPTPCRS